MNVHRHVRFLACCLLLASPLPAATVGTGGGRPAGAESLRQRCDPALESLRAGGPGDTGTLTGEERTALRSAEGRSADLLDLRAGGVGGLLVVVALVLIILVLI